MAHGGDAVPETAGTNRDLADDTEAKREGKRDGTVRTLTPETMEGTVRHGEARRRRN